GQRPPERASQALTGGDHAGQDGCGLERMVIDLIQEPPLHDLVELPEVEDHAGHPIGLPADRDLQVVVVTVHAGARPVERRIVLDRERGVAELVGRAEVVHARQLDGHTASSARTSTYSVGSSNTRTCHRRSEPCSAAGQLSTQYLWPAAKEKRRVLYAVALMPTAPARIDWPQVRDRTSPRVVVPPLPSLDAASRRSTISPGPSPARPGSGERQAIPPGGRGRPPEPPPPGTRRWEDRPPWPRHRRSRSPPERWAGKSSAPVHILRRGSSARHARGRRRCRQGRAGRPAPLCRPVSTPF